MVFFGFTENLRSMTHKDFIGTSKFNKIQADFNTIKDIKISDLLKESGNLSLLNGVVLTPESLKPAPKEEIKSGEAYIRTSIEKDKVTELYLDILPIMRQYNIDRAQLQRNK